MNKYFLSISLIVLSFQAWSFDCAPQTEVSWEHVSDGVMWSKYDLSYTPYIKEARRWETQKSRSVTVRALKIDLSKNKLRFLSPDHHVSCNPANERYIARVIADSGAPVIAAINASFFEMPAGRIHGMALDEETIWSTDIASQTISSSSIFGILDGEYFLEPKASFLEEYGPVISTNQARKFSFALQAYPRLVKDGELQVSDSVLNSRRARTSIGVDEASDQLLLVTIDARAETAKTGMTLWEYAHFVQTPQCGVPQKMALNLDGGGSSAFAIPSKKVVEQADRCRHLGNILTVQPKIPTHIYVNTVSQ